MALDWVGSPSEHVSVDANDSMLMRLLEAPPRCRVLLVDDDDLVRQRLAVLVKKSGYDFETAASGVEALRVLRSTSCQIVITDWQMPEMDGIALCREVRRSHAEAYVYLLMWTVRDGSEDLLAGLEAGADDFILKGAAPEVLLARLSVGRRITHVESALRLSNRENRRLSETDPLTGAYNLRYLQKALPRELARVRRNGHPLALLSCDIDGFKQVNDRHGHAAGDGVLRGFFDRSMQCLRRSNDWIARVGGDEFVVVMPETSLQEASSVAHRMCRCFDPEAAAAAGPQVGFSVSIGAVAIEAGEQARFAPAKLVEEMLRAADSCLYASKRLGRDQVTALAVADWSSNRTPAAHRPRAG